MGHIRTSFSCRRMLALLTVFVCLLINSQDAVSQQSAELYLVSGYPTDTSEVNVPTRIYRFSPENKAFAFVNDLLGKDETTAFIRAYHEKRLLILATPHYQPERLIVLNMDNPCHPRVIGINSKAFLPSNFYLLYIPNKGLFLALSGWSIEKSQNLLLILNLITGTQETLDASVLKFAQLPGLSGLGHMDDYFMNLFIDPNGFLRIPWREEAGKRLINLDWPTLPHAAQPEEKKGRWSAGGTEQAMGDAIWIAGTADYEVLFPRKRSGEARKQVFQMLDKSQGIWRPLTVYGDYPNGFTQLKPFGTWLAGIPVKEAIQGITKENETINKATNENRRADYRYLRLLYKNPKPEIFLYDTKTDKDYTIHTGDMESEVLLIENDTVYYRVKDRLYRSVIREDRVEEPQLLMQDPALASVYWAFSGPFCEADPK